MALMQNLRQFRCGACGSASFRIYLADGNKEHPVKMVAECNACGSTSVISISQPTMQIEFGENSEGRLTIFSKAGEP